MCCSPWGHKKLDTTQQVNNNDTSSKVFSLVAQKVKTLPAIQEIWVLCLGGEDPLDKEMATPSIILDLRISWTEGPGRLQSMGLQGVGHN